MPHDHRQDHHQIVDTDAYKETDTNTDEDAETVAWSRVVIRLHVTNEKGLSSLALIMMMPAEKAMKVLKAKANTPATRKRRRSSGAGKAYDVFAGLTTSSAAFSILVPVLAKLVAAHCGKSGRHSQSQWTAATLPKKSGPTSSFLAA